MLSAYIFVTLVGNVIGLFPACAVYKDWNRYSEYMRLGTCSAKIITDIPRHMKIERWGENFNVKNYCRTRMKGIYRLPMIVLIFKDDCIEEKHGNESCSYIGITSKTRYERVI